MNNQKTDWFSKVWGEPPPPTDNEHLYYNSDDDDDDSENEEMFQSFILPETPKLICQSIPIPPPQMQNLPPSVPPLPKTFTSTQRKIVQKPYILSDGSNVLGIVSYFSKKHKKTYSAKILNDGITLIDDSKRVYAHSIHFIDVCEGVENPRIYISTPDIK
jgi:hypothetical protein